MDLPPAIVLRSIEDFAVVFFKDRTHEDAAPPHFYVIFPVSETLRFSVNIITSQVSKRSEYYERVNRKALLSLVFLKAEDFSFLNRESVVDCNRMEIFTIEELVKRIDPRGEFDLKTRIVPDHIKDQIFRAIEKSPLIPQAMKSIISAPRKGG